MTSKMKSQNGIFLMVLGVWGQRRPRMLPRSPPDTRQAQFFIKISLKAAQVCSSTAFSTVFYTSRIVLSMFFLMYCQSFRMTFVVPGLLLNCSLNHVFQKSHCLKQVFKKEIETVAQTNYFVDVQIGLVPD